LEKIKKLKPRGLPVSFSARRSKKKSAQELEAAIKEMSKIMEGFIKEGKVLFEEIDGNYSCFSLKYYKQTC